MEKYKQLSLEERCQISHLCQNGFSIRKIAASMDRTPSTISRELKRNASSNTAYKPAYANQIYQSRRWTGSRLIRNPELQKHVLKHLSQGWSPEQVVGRLALEKGHRIISHESIYRFIYAQIARTKDYTWRHYLPRSKFKRGYRGRRGGSPALHISNRVSIHERTPQADVRTNLGHWEADLMCFAKYGQYLLVAQDRSSRFLFISKPRHKTAEQIAQILFQLFQCVPHPLRQTITFDNGTEFAYHEHLHALGMRTYFCDTHSPWQKGGIENAVGRLRKVLPRKTNLANLDNKELLDHTAAYNHTPRKCLGFKTPAEVFLSKVLHFKCESTSQPSLGRQ